MRHYHGNHGIPGCLFDMEEHEVFASKREAASWVRQDMAEYRDLGYDRPARVPVPSTSIPGAFYLFSSDSGARIVIEVWECRDAECAP